MNNLVKITKLLKGGERVVVVNDNIEPQFVIMDALEYEKMVNNNWDIKDLTEEELLSKINRDIALWKSTQGDDNIDMNTGDFAEEIDNFELAEDDDDEDDEYYFEPVEGDED